MALALADHFGARVFRQQPRFEGCEIRQRFRSPRTPVALFVKHHLSQAGAALDQGVELGGDLCVVVGKGELEVLERLQLADKSRDGAEAAVVEVELSQRLKLPELRRERLDFRKRAP